MTKVSFSEYCDPAKLYLTISLISIVIISIFHEMTIQMLLLRLIIILLWSWLLNYICSKGDPNISWALVVIPYIIFLFSVFYIIYKKKINK